VRDRLRAAGIPGPERDARLLAEMSFGLRGIDLITREGQAADAAALERLEVMTRRRLAGEPIARIAGEKAFYGLDFVLSPETLVPRPETEMLVDFALERLDPGLPVRVLDLGTGTGCVAIAILTHLARAQAVAVDLSAGALACAGRNAARHGVAERFAVREGSWFEPVGAEERFDLIVSNPPYIESGELAALMPEVREHDPVLALDGGEDGLAPYRVIAARAAEHLLEGAWIALEAGGTQGQAVSALLTAGGLAEAEVKKDLAGLDRMIIAHHVNDAGADPLGDQYFPLGNMGRSG